MVDDVLNRSVSLVVGGFDFAVGLVLLVGFALKETTGDWSADALVEQDKHQGDFGALVSEPIAIAFTIALHQP